MDVVYEKSQFAKVWVIVLLAAAIINIIVFLSIETDPTKAFGSALILSGVFLLILLFFYQLKIRIKPDRIQLIYGIGLLKFNVKIEKYFMVEEVKTPWYYGFGIRFTPQGILYNIQGSKAINLVYEQKGKMKKVMIGTATPQELIQAIEVNFEKAS